MPTTIPVKPVYPTPTGAPIATPFYPTPTGQPIPKVSPESVIKNLASKLIPFDAGPVINKLSTSFKSIVPTPDSIIQKLTSKIPPATKSENPYQNLTDLLQGPSLALGKFLIEPAWNFLSSGAELATGTPLPKLKIPALTKNIESFVDASSYQQKYTESITAGINAKNNALGWVNMKDTSEIPPELLARYKKEASKSNEDIEKDAYKNVFLQGLSDAIMLAGPIKSSLGSAARAVIPETLIKPAIETVSKDTLFDYFSGRKTAEQLGLSPEIRAQISAKMKVMTTAEKTTFLQGFDLLKAKPSVIGNIFGVSQDEANQILADIYNGPIRKAASGFLPGYKMNYQAGGANIKGEPVGFGEEPLKIDSLSVENVKNAIEQQGIRPKIGTIIQDNAGNTVKIVSIRDDTTGAINVANGKMEVSVEVPGGIPRTIEVKQILPSKSKSVNQAAERAKAGEVFGMRPERVVVPTFNQLTAENKVRIVNKDGNDVYQYKNPKGEWVRAADEDTAVAKVTAEPKPPALPKEKVYAPQDQAKLEGTRAQLENVRERLAEHPARPLLKYLKEGDFQDFKNEQLAKTPAEAARIKAKNKEIMGASMRAFDSIPGLSERFDNPDTIREVIENYRNARDVEKTLVAMRNDLEQNLVPLLDEKLIAKQTLQNQKDIALKERRRKLDLAQKKVNAEQAAKEDKALKIQNEIIKPPEGRKLNTLNPKSSLDPETRGIYDKFARVMAESKIVGLKYANQMPAIDKLGIKAFDAFEGGVAPWQWEIRQKFDALYSYARKNGFEELGYETHYLPHIYKESPAQINSAIIKSLEKKGMTKSEIDAYLAGKRLSPDQSMHLKLNPFFAEYRVFKTYAEAATFGLSPKFTKMSELLGVYEKLLLRTSAARNLIEDLTDAGKIVPEQVAPQSWQPIKYGPRGIKGYWASPKIGNFLDGVFRGHENMGLTDSITSAVAELSRFGQNIALSGGAPFTSVNFFTAGVSYKEMVRGNLKVFKDFLVSNSDSATIKSLQNDYHYIEMMVRNGIPFRSIAGVRPDSYESVKTKWGKLTSGVKMNPLTPSTYSPFFGIVGDSVDNVFGKKTFSNFLPLLHVQVFKDTYNNLIKQGLSDELAQVTATRLTMNVMGITEDLGRSQMTQDRLTALFFAPVYRENIINVLLNLPRAINPVTRTAYYPELKPGEKQPQKPRYQYHFFNEDSNIRNPMYRYSRHLLAGLTVALGVYNLINHRLNGNYTWDNPQGHEADLMIPLPNGQVAYVPFMPGFLALPRSIIGGVKGIFAGDVNLAFEQIGQGFSMVVKTGFDVLTNTNYFGNNIYNDTDTREKKITKVAQYIGLEFNHPYVKELVNQITSDTPKPLYQSIITATELPVKFTTRAKINQGKFYDTIAAHAQENAVAKESVQKIREQVLELAKQGKKNEILNLVKDFTPDQIQIYKDLNTAEKSKSTISSEQKVLPIYLKIQKFAKEGRKDEILSLVKDFTPEDIKAYKLLVNRLK